MSAVPQQLLVRVTPHVVTFGAADSQSRVHFLRNVLAQIPKGSAEMVAAAIRTYAPILI
jgi:putative transposase